LLNARRENHFENIGPGIEVNNIRAIAIEPSMFQNALDSLRFCH